MNTGCSVSYEGELEVWTQEGGYASPCVAIGGVDLTVAIQALAPTEGPSTEGSREGTWRITVERIDDE